MTCGKLTVKVFLPETHFHRIGCVVLNVAFGAPTPADRFDVCRCDRGSQQDGGDMTGDCHGVGNNHFGNHGDEFQFGDGPDDGGLGGEQDR